MKDAYLVIYSAEPQLMLQFTWDVLEWCGDLDLVEGNGMRCKILPHPAVKLAKKNKWQMPWGVEITLQVETLEELMQYKQRYEFFHYRHELSTKSSELEGEGLELCDPDGRVWRVEVFSEQRIAIDQHRGEVCSSPSQKDI